jgi:hypothetical protein
MERPPVFWETEASTEASKRRRPVQRGPLGRLGNWTVKQLCCSGAPRRCVASQPGKPGGEARPAVREPRAVRSAHSLRATEASVTASWCGRPLHEVGVVGRATGRRDRLRVWADPCSEVRAIPRATARSSGLHGFGVHGWGPLSCLGNWATQRASRIGKPRRGVVHREGNLAVNGVADRL